jgi:thiol-disulfide isomerase/thioredoxin
MEHLNPAQFENLFLVEKALVLFYADWCPFCQRFIPIFQSVIAKSKFTTGYKTYGAKLNEDANPLWDKFSISAVRSRRDAKMGIGLTKPDLDSLLDDLDWR